MAEELTGRGSLVLYLYYREGLSFRQISKLTCLPRSTVYDIYQRCLAELAERTDLNNPDAILSIEGVLTQWCGGEQRRKPRIAALRQEWIAQELDQRMDIRAAEMAALSECMGANDSVSHKRNKGPAWTQSEMRYLNETGRESVPREAYRVCKHGRSLPAFCAGDPATCGLCCAGCRG